MTEKGDQIADNMLTFSKSIKDLENQRLFS